MRRWSRTTLLHTIVFSVLVASMSTWQTAAAESEVAESDAAEPTASVVIPRSQELPSAVFEGVSFSVGSSTRPCLDPWGEPPAGADWVCVLVVIENQGEDTVRYGPHQFSLAFGDKGIAKPIGGTIDGLPSGKLEPGGAAIGVVRFQLPKGQPAGKLSISSPNGASTERLTLQ
ncbi:MAG: DUF4352 domain-containing protein [Chloroflexota bacterium]